jgi:hypothetical protein
MDPWDLHKPIEAAVSRAEIRFHSDTQEMD